jgi:hypothetical protein
VKSVIVSSGLSGAPALIKEQREYLPKEMSGNSTVAAADMSVSIYGEDTNIKEHQL